MQCKMLMRHRAHSHLFTGAPLRPGHLGHLIVLCSRIFPLHHYLGHAFSLFNLSRHRIFSKEQCSVPREETLIKTNQGFAITAPIITLNKSQRPQFSCCKCKRCWSPCSALDPPRPRSPAAGVGLLRLHTGVRRPSAPRLTRGLALPQVKTQSPRHGPQGPE